MYMSLYEGIYLFDDIVMELNQSWHFKLIDPFIVHAFTDLVSTNRYGLLTSSSAPLRQPGKPTDV